MGHAQAELRRAQAECEAMRAASEAVAAATATAHAAAHAAANAEDASQADWLVADAALAAAAAAERPLEGSSATEGGVAAGVVQQTVPVVDSEGVACAPYVMSNCMPPPGARGDAPSVSMPPPPPLSPPPSRWGMGWLTHCVQPKGTTDDALASPKTPAVTLRAPGVVGAEPHPHKEKKKGRASAAKKRLKQLFRRRGL